MKLSGGYLARFTEGQARIFLISYILKLVARKPNHPVLPKELSEAMTSLREDPTMKDAIPGWVARWEHNLVVLFAAKSADIAEALCRLSIRTTGSVGTTLATLYPEQEVGERKLAGLTAIIRALISQEKGLSEASNDHVDDGHAEIQTTTLMLLLTETAQHAEDAFLQQADVNGLLSVRLAAFLMTNWQALETLHRDDVDCLGKMSSLP